VRDAFTGLTPGGVDLAGEVILPQGVYQPVAFDPSARLRLREEFGVPAKARLLLGLGYGDLRKGFDLFLQLWRASRSRDKPVHCLWAGKLDPALTGYLQPEIAAAMEAGSFHLAGFRRDVAALLSAADVFVLTSREDPLPSTVLEALAAGLPSVAFLGSGGVPEMLAELVAGEAVPMGDVGAMARAARRLGDLADVEIAERRERLAAIAREHFDFGRYARDIVDHVDPTLLAVSVAVPNYNYARYLPMRLGSIFGQTLPVREVVLLDDASTDDSLSVAGEFAETWRRDLRILPNAHNSGAVLRQWRKAAEAVSGRYLWIAEADDDSDPRFLEMAVAALDADPLAAMAFTDSASIDEAGEMIEPSYQHYYNISAPGFLTIDGVFPGALFLERCLAERNLILNVSSVVWRRSALLAAFERCEAALDTFTVAGDWRLYAEVLSVPDARIAYVASPLNRHRRHRASVTRLLDADRHVAEIAAAQAAVARFLPLQAARIARQKQYLEEVSKQLGAGDVPPRVRDSAKRAARATRSLKAGR
jgi:hypothetical protein